MNKPSEAIPVGRDEANYIARSEVRQTILNDLNLKSLDMVTLLRKIDKLPIFVASDFVSTPLVLGGDDFQTRCEQTELSGHDGSEAKSGDARDLTSDDDEFDPYGAAEQWGMQFALKLFGEHIAGLENWVGGDGSESVDGDVLCEFNNIAKAAGWLTVDGDTIFGPSRAENRDHYYTRINSGEVWLCHDKKRQLAMIEIDGRALKCSWDQIGQLLDLIKSANGLEAIEAHNATHPTDNASAAPSEGDGQ